MKSSAPKVNSTSQTILSNERRMRDIHSVEISCCCWYIHHQVICYKWRQSWHCLHCQFLSWLQNEKYLWSEYCPVIHSVMDKWMGLSPPNINLSTQSKVCVCHREVILYNSHVVLTTALCTVHVENIHVKTCTFSKWTVWDTFEVAHKIKT